MAIASFKAFGDFVIAHSVASAIRDHRECVRILAGSHLDALAAVTPEGVTVTRVPVSENRLPALFDARKRGIAAALCSGLELEKALGLLERRPNERLLVDRVCMRTRWIGRSWPLTSTAGGARNIYASYVLALKRQGFEVLLDSTPHPVRGRRVGIFPGSRIATKALPTSVLRVVLRAIARAEFNPSIIRIDGDAAIEGLPSTTIPRTFGSLRDTLNTLDVVISADSLPAHLAEYIGRRVFVVSRSPNPYWLPHRCFEHGDCSLFAAADLETSIRDFLQSSVRERAVS